MLKVLALEGILGKARVCLPCLSFLYLTMIPLGCGETDRQREWEKGGRERERKEEEEDLCLGERTLWRESSQWVKQFQGTPCVLDIHRYARTFCHRLAVLGTFLVTHATSYLSPEMVPTMRGEGPLART